MNHTPIFEGRWGDFGAHVDHYQGIVEQAIKNTMSMSDYFIGNPDDIQIQVYDDGGRLKSESDPVCFVRLIGTKEFHPEDLAQGVPGTLSLMIEGYISVDSNGNVFFEIYNTQEIG